MYKGDERQRTIEVSVDGVFVTSWTSSGETLDFESINLSGTSGQEVTITAVLGDSDWVSITEVGGFLRGHPTLPHTYSKQEVALTTMPCVRFRGPRAAGVNIGA